MNSNHIHNCALKFYSSSQRCNEATLFRVLLVGKPLFFEYQMQMLKQSSATRVGFAIDGMKQWFSTFFKSRNLWKVKDHLAEPKHSQYYFLKVFQGSQ